MDNFGLDKHGFKRKTYTDILESMENRAKELFGEDINLNNFSPLGMFLKVISWGLSILWQLAEKVYYSAFIDDAEGVNLDKVARNIGVYRRGEQYSFGEIILEGEEGTTITPDNLIIGTRNEVNFQPMETVTIDSSGKAIVRIKSLLPGVENNVEPNTITEIITPIVGLNKVCNEEKTTGGRNAETDTEFRERYYQSLSRQGSSTLNSIMASLYAIENVRTALVIENTSMEVVNGMPPKSIQAYVLGGESKDIAQAIFSTKPAGIETVGTETEVIKDISGLEHTVKFSYATEKDVYINITLTKSATYRADGDKLIKSALVKYIGGTDTDGQTYAGLNIGQDIILTKLISIISNIEGVLDFDIQIGLSAESLSSSNIAIGETEVAILNVDNVVINHV